MLQGKTAFVTGSTQGVGRAMARAIVAAGGRVVLHGLADDDHARQTVADCQGADIVFGDLAGCGRLGSVLSNQLSCRIKDCSSCFKLILLT